MSPRWRAERKRTFTLGLERAPTWKKGHSHGQKSRPVQALHVAAYIEALNRALLALPAKLRLAEIRRLFDERMIGTSGV